jgi:hypothetical protein
VKTFPRGYPNLAAFVDSDERFMIFRRFGYLQSRLLLYKQDELRALEARLDSLDESDKLNNPDRLFMRCTDEPDVDDDERRNIVARKNLYRDIENAYRDYGIDLCCHNEAIAL